MTKHILLIALLTLISACGGGSSTTTPTLPPPTVETRSFYMGFTPWPYDATIEAVNNTYQLAQNNGDIINHHIMQGIPFEEAFNQTTYPAHLEDEISSKISQTVAGKIILLEVGSLNGSRTMLAENWGANGEEPRSALWETRNFDDAEVITAYSNFAIEMINRFQPEYFNYGTEVSELIISDINQFNKFLVFAEQVYNNIKAAHPQVKLMVSVALKTPSSTESQLIMQNMPDIMNYVDVLGVSVYPYVFFNHSNKGDPANLPSDWLSQISQIASNKPIAITETGWIAEDLVINSFALNILSNEAFQRTFVIELLQQSDQLNLEFVVWWSLIDYSALWEGALQQSDLAAIWRDIGLYDEQVQGRSGLTEWQTYFQKQKQ